METTYLMSRATSSASKRWKKIFISLEYFLSYRTLKRARQKKAKG